MKIKVNWLGRFYFSSASTQVLNGLARHAWAVFIPASQLDVQTSRVNDLDAELKIEREWRQQLEMSSRKDKEIIASLKQEVVFLDKVAGVWIS